MFPLELSPYGIGDFIAGSILIFLVWAWVRIWSKKLD